MADAMSENDRSSDDRDEDAEQLSPEEIRLVELLGGGCSMDDAATTIGKSARTLRRWKRKPQVAAAIRERTSEQMALTRAVLAAGANRAARELEKLCVVAKPDAARVAACKAVLEGATKFGELADLEERLAELEARLDEQNGHGLPSACSDSESAALPGQDSEPKDNSAAQSSDRGQSEDE